MLANGPQWTKAGPPSSVCIRFGLRASLSSTAIEPATLQVLGGDRGAVLPGGQDDPAEPGAEVLEVRGQGEDRHDLGRDGDHELGLARVAVVLAAQAHHDVAQGAVADVEHARPEHVVGVDAQLVAVVDVVVDERRGEVVRRADRVDVAREVEVEVLHRDDLGVAAARGAALDPEHRAQADGWRSATAAFLPIRLRPWARPTVVVLLPSPSGVGVMAVTRTYLPRGRSRSGPLDALDRDLGLGAAVQLDLVVDGSPARGRRPRSGGA